MRVHAFWHRKQSEYDFLYARIFSPFAYGSTLKVGLCCKHQFFEHGMHVWIWYLKIRVVQIIFCATCMSCTVTLLAPSWSCMWCCKRRTSHLFQCLNSWQRGARFENHWQLHTMLSKWTWYCAWTMLETVVYSTSNGMALLGCPIATLAFGHCPLTHPVKCIDNECRR
jgi:hypothetical protein